MTSSQFTPEVQALVSGQNYFIVKDSLDFMYELAAFSRSQKQRGMITAVTGSAGKSTTCSMLAHALKNMDVGRVLTPTGNQNLFDLVASQISRSINFSHLIPEVAISTLDKYKKNSFSVGADVSIITSISAAHAQGLTSTEQIAEKKSAIFDSPPPGGTAIINRDTLHGELLVKRAVEAGRQVVTYGESSGATFVLKAFDPVISQATVKFGSSEIKYKIGAPGKHMAINSLAVLATLRAYHLDDWNVGIQSLSTFLPVEGRGDSFEIDLASGTRIEIIDETFNANPASMTAAIESLASRPKTHQRKIAVLGEILELGSLSEESHRSLAPTLKRAQLDSIFLFGTEMSALGDELQRLNVPYTYEKSAEDAVKAAFNVARGGDVILLKASGSTGLKDYVKSKLRPAAVFTSM